MVSQIMKWVDKGQKNREDQYDQKVKSIPLAIITRDEWQKHMDHAQSASLCSSRNERSLEKFADVFQKQTLILEMLTKSAEHQERVMEQLLSTSIRGD
jgi:hypothetical protein